MSLITKPQEQHDRLETLREQAMLVAAMAPEIADELPIIQAEEHFRFRIQAVNSSPKLAEKLAAIGPFVHTDIFSLHPNSGHDLHIHDDTDAIIYVPEQPEWPLGSTHHVFIVIGDTWHEAKAGEFFIVPRGVPHDVVNNGDTTCRFLSIQSRPIAQGPDDVDYRSVRAAE